MPTTRLAPGPVPVIINVGGVNESAFLDYGIALATFNSDDVAADSTTPGGAFWDLYSGRDIGTNFPQRRASEYVLIVCCIQVF